VDEEEGISGGGQSGSWVYGVSGGEGGFARAGEGGSAMDGCLLDGADAVDVLVAVRLACPRREGERCPWFLESTKCLNPCLNFAIDFGVESCGGGSIGNGEGVLIRKFDTSSSRGDSLTTSSANSSGSMGSPESSLFKGHFVMSSDGKGKSLVMVLLGFGW
jgi:hypothetical protein